VTVLESTRRTWQAMERRPLPRNVKAISAARARGRLGALGVFVVSFVGETAIDAPHVYVDAGKRYDWRFASDLQACIVVAIGVDAKQTVADLFEATEAYPTLIDFDRRTVASVVEDGTSGGLKLWPRARGSEAWRALFD
jgi:hypothetical protein